jgi:beta-barrel assembly-enhancing protease
MNKVLIQGSILISIFIGAWFTLQLVDFESIFHVKEITDTTESKLGETFWKVAISDQKEVYNKQVTKNIKKLFGKICKANDIDSSKITIHIIESEEVNAFALPAGHLVIYSGLIEKSDNVEELSGVICHELAHIELNHVMKKLIKEFGLTAIISMSTGNSDALSRQAIKLISSTAFDRSLEEEADLKAVDYLINAKINPEPFANFLYKLSLNESDLHEDLSWVSTHPMSEDRSDYIIDKSSKVEIKFESPLTKEEWLELRESIQD